MRLKTRVVLDKAWTDGLRRAPGTVNARLKLHLKTLGQAVQKKAQERAPVGPGGRHKQRLSKSIRVWVKGLKAIVGSTLWYARVRELGSQAFPSGAITPRRKKWLHFQVGQKWVKVYRVTQKGAFYLKGGLEDAGPEMQKIARDGAQDLAKTVFGGR